LKLLAAAGAVSAGVILFVSAHGGGHASSKSSTAASGGAPPLVPRRFASFAIAMDQELDYLDPGLSYTTEGWGVMWNVYLPLIGYTHAGGPEGATLVPYLARALPRVSMDGTTYTLTLRRGLRYSNGARVRASDFKATVERDYQLDSVGARFFDDIVGASEYAQTGEGGISGIVTNDATGRITIHLKAPESDFENVLATLFAAPVPAATPPEDMSTDPIPSTGPYVIADYAPDQRIVEMRNARFRAAALGGNVPAGNPDMVTWNMVGTDAAALQAVISGKDDWMSYHPIPSDSLGSVREKYADRLKVFTPANTYYFFMNTHVPPFDDVRVRRAVNYAIDRAALVRLAGGLARPTENILPPTYPRYPQRALYRHDLAKAKRLVTASGDRGMRVTVWNHDHGADWKLTAYLVDVLNSIGFHARQKIVSANVYWARVGNPAAKAQIGFADWFEDYPHPLNWFDPLLNGAHAGRSYSNNYAHYDNPEVDRLIERLKRRPRLTPVVERAWAALDETVMRDAPWAPFFNREQTDFFSARVDLGCYENHVVYEFDYATICISESLGRSRGGRSSLRRPGKPSFGVVTRAKAASPADR
jgi:peptide/nickel transport system substrate-binding protein